MNNQLACDIQRPKTSATRGLAIGSVSVLVAVLMGAGVAHADGQTMTCPIAVTPGGSGTVTLGGFTPDIHWPIYVNEYANKEGPNVPGGVGSGNGPMAVTWPSTPLGEHTYYATVVNNTEGASCTFNVQPAALPEPGPPPAGGDRIGLPSRNQLEIRGDQAPDQAPH